MDLDSIFIKDSKGFKHLTAEEKARRKEMNLCMYCGEAGHSLMACPKKASSKGLNLLELNSDCRNDSPILVSSTLTIRQGNNTSLFNLQGLLDSGASSNFISEDFVKQKNLISKNLDSPVSVRLADGRTVAITRFLSSVDVATFSGAARSTVVLDLMVVQSLKYPLVLGMPWFKLANLVINWVDKSIVFPGTQKILNSLVQDGNLRLRDEESTSFKISHLQRMVIKMF
jgi:hypothetical protein